MRALTQAHVLPTEPLAAADKTPLTNEGFTQRPEATRTADPASIQAQGPFFRKKYAALKIVGAKARLHQDEDDPRLITRLILATTKALNPKLSKTLNSDLNPKPFGLGRPRIVGAEEVFAGGSRAFGLQAVVLTTMLESEAWSMGFGLL